jgi:hypothetical protein
MAYNICADDGSLDSSILPLYILDGWDVHDLHSTNTVVDTFWDKGNCGKKRRRQLIRAARKNATSLYSLTKAWDIKWAHLEECIETGDDDDICRMFINHPWWDELFNETETGKEKAYELRKSLAIPENYGAKL